ncbi:helix-turn-helix domain-containing protein [Spirosoma agri]
MIDLAKEKLLSEPASVSEIAYELGFKYPRLFKQHVGYTPKDYRNSLH